MNREEILTHVDHTLLAQTATWEQIRKTIDEGLKYHTASVCIPPSYVKKAAEYAAGRIAICTVIGFPNGYNTTAVKVFETENAVENGADEIDMVINLGWLKDRRLSKMEKEIRLVKAACQGRVLKVIIETCLLTEEEKVEMCHVVERAGADYIKTSTGFSKGGATPEDVDLMRRNSPDTVKVKAAGGIASFDDAAQMMELGADRLGTSRLVRIAGEEGLI